MLDLLGLREMLDLLRRRENARSVRTERKC